MAAVFALLPRPCWSGNSGEGVCWIVLLNHPPMFTQSYVSHCLHLPSFSQKVDLCAGSISVCVCVCVCVHWILSRSLGYRDNCMAKWRVTSTRGVTLQVRMSFPFCSSKIRPLLPWIYNILSFLILCPCCIYWFPWEGRGITLTEIWIVTIKLQVRLVPKAKKAREGPEIPGHVQIVQTQVGRLICHNHPRRIVKRWDRS